MKDFACTMKDFAELYLRLDATTSSNAKLQALRDYFAQAPAADPMLRELATAMAGLPDWLFEESYQSVGDLAETISLLLPQHDHDSDEGLAQWVELHLLPLRGQPAEVVGERLPQLWLRLDRPSLMLCLKLITGSFRVGVSKLLVTRALAQLCDLDPKRVAQRLVGYTDLSHRPTPDSYLKLIAPESDDEHAQRGGQPYPFFLAHALQAPVEDFATLIGPVEDWQVEWKWDGIRAQVVKREGQLWIWSRGEELVTERFPELHSLAETLPDGVVLDGEILVWKPGTTQDAPAVQPFALLQQRLGRKILGKKLLADAPVVLQAYDLLEYQGEDWRSRPQHERRSGLERLLNEHPLAPVLLSPLLQADDWAGLAEQREQSRSLGVEGLMLKRRDALYGVGRTKDLGVWWKWKIDPFADLCPARPWPPRQPLQRLHLRRLGCPCRCSTTHPGALRQGLFGAQRRRNAQGRCDHPQDHRGDLRPGAQRQADPRVRARFRRYRPVQTSQERDRRALSTDAPLAPGQARGRGRRLGHLAESARSDLTRLPVCGAHVHRHAGSVCASISSRHDQRPRSPGLPCIT